MVKTSLISLLVGAGLVATASMALAADDLTAGLPDNLKAL